VAGTRTGTVSVYSNASDSPTVVSLTGTGYDTPYTQVSATALTFSPQNAGTASAPQAVTVTNTGDETESLSIYYPYLGADFTAVDNCSVPLAPGASCVVEVTFTPSQTGLRTASLYIQGGSPTINISLTGTGLAAGATGVASFSATALSFGSEIVGSTTTYQGVYLEDTSSEPFTVSAITVSGDFALYSTNCGALPFQLTPQSSCIVYTTFTPSAASTRTGNLTFTDTATGGTQSVALSGTGLAAGQELEFYPSSGVDFGVNVPVGGTSGTITVYAQNAGTSTLTIDRVLVMGDFAISSTNCSDTALNGTTEDGTGTLSYCYVNVVFKPTAAGLRTGALTFVDGASNSPQSVSLAGNAIADTGTAAVTPDQLDFSTQAVGTTSGTQGAVIVNPGNTAITINSYKTGTGNFSTTNWYCPAVPFTLTAGASCGVYVQFTPATTGTLTDALTVSGSIGTATVALSGSGVAESKTIGFTPASPMNSGSVAVGQGSGAGGSSDSEGGDLVSIRNTGTAAVTFSASPVISGTNAADFTLYNPYACGNNATKLQPGASCPMWISFKPSVAAAESATLTFTDDATGTTQALALSGTGIAADPKYYLTNNLINFDNQVVGSTSATNTYVYFYNNSGAAVTLGNAVLSSGFLVPSNGGQDCNGQTIQNGGRCYSYISFAPTSAGLITGTITFKSSGGTTLVSAPLTGYAPAAAPAVLLTPATINFATPQVVKTTASYQTTVLTNTGNTALTVGPVTGTNVGAAAPYEFSIYSDQCGGRALNPGGTCTEYVEFTPTTAGARIGTLSFPITYASGGTATVTASLTGTGVAEVNSAVMQPGNGLFVDQTVGVQSLYVVTLYLVNRGNLAFKVNTVVGVNTIVDNSTPGEFSAESAQGGYDGCSGATVQPNTGSCQMNVTFTPSTTGTRTGSMSFPVTFADGTTTTVVATLSGNGAPAAPTLEFQPASLAFQPEIINNTSAQNYITVRNIGNKPVRFSSVASPSAGFILGSNQDGCYAQSLNTLAVGGTCYIYVSFAPTATGNITGTLTINDNATGGPHKLPLTGTGILANQQIAISQTALTFATQPEGSTSSPQAVYVTNQSDASVTSLNVVLSGTNAADYQLSNGCSTSLGARAVCIITVKFSPAATATGTRTASITVSDSDTGSPRTITLTGSAIAAGPAVSLAPPSPLTFKTQNVGTTSGTMNFSVTNTGTGNLTVSSVGISGTNAGDFSIVSDGCSGAVLTQDQNCIVGVRFAPAYGGARMAVASVIDSAPGSPHTIALSGTGYGIPSANLTASALTYATTSVGSATAAQSVTLSNPGTDTLKIASIALTGPNGGDFTKPVTTCGATLAPGASCTISTEFAPIAAGIMTAAITITDNANNVQGATESMALTGTGTSDVSVSPTSINYGDLPIGTTHTVDVTVTNIGTIANLTVSAASSAPGFVILSTGNTCTTGVAPGKSCTLPVEFSPSSAGTETGVVTITTNGGANPQIAVAGAGTTDVAVSSSSIAFGSISFGTTETSNLTVTNNGSASFTLSPAISGAGFLVASSGKTCGASLAAKASCVLPIEYAPAAVGAATGSLTLTTSGGSSPVIALIGTATSDVSVSTTSVNYGSVSYGTTKVVNVTVSNVGTIPSLPVAVIGYAFWQTHFAGAHNVIGASIEIDHKRATVIGVMPLGFDFPSSETSVWVPLSFIANWPAFLTARQADAFNAIARLKPGITFQQSQHEMDSISARLNREYPLFEAGKSVNVVRLAAELVPSNTRTALWMLFGAVLFLMLIACANVATLLLARQDSRERESAIRLALGASSAHLIRLQMLECLLLSLFSALPGLAIAAAAIPILRALVPPKST